MIYKQEQLHWNYYIFRISKATDITMNPVNQDTSIVREEPISWEEVCQIIKTNHLEKLKRSKSKLTEYKRFKDYLKENNISSTAILLGDDLQWAKVDSNHQILETYLEARSDKLLRDPKDIKIIENRFPYNFESNITHLLVWTKVPIESDPTSSRGDISTYTRKLINKYIWNTFVKGLGIPKSNIIWFRNWHALQSIRELSHIHVLIKDLSPEQLRRIKGTPGVPLSDDDYIELAQL